MSRLNETLNKISDFFSVKKETNFSGAEFFANSIPLFVVLFVILLIIWVVNYTLNLLS